MKGDNGWLANGEIFGVISSPSAPPRGSGKSLMALQFAIEQADLLNYGLCCNFDIDLTALYQYSWYNELFSLCKNIERGLVFCTSILENKEVNLEKFMNKSRTVYILDEAGIYVNARNWQKLSLQFQADLALLRRYRKRLWWVSQYFDQVDKNLREQTNYIIECSSILKASKKLGGASEIFIKMAFAYIRLDYENLYIKRQRMSPIKFAIQQFFKSKIKRITRFGIADRLAFKIYNSFDLMDGGPPTASNPPPKQLTRSHLVTCNGPIFPSGFSQLELQALAREFSEGFDWELLEDDYAFKKAG